MECYRSVTYVLNHLCYPCLDRTKQGFQLPTTNDQPEMRISEA